MKLTFQLRFHTNLGQSLWLVSNHQALAIAELENAIPMEYLNSEFWQVSVPLSDLSAPNGPIAYHYVLQNPDGSTIPDWGHGRVLDRAALAYNETLIVDSWNYPGFFQNTFYTEPFTQVLLQPNQTDVPPTVTLTPTHTFKVKAPLLAKGQTLCLLGDGPLFGYWSTDNPILLGRTAGVDFLKVKLDLSQQWFPFAYKYGVYDVEKRSFVRYEDGPNRSLHHTLAPGRHTVVNDGFVRLPADTWRGAGAAIPIFSLRSEKSFGVGEFTDLKLLADWGKRVGLKLIQILPINDTTVTHSWTDCYPYAGISAFALHPMYLNLERVVSAANKKLLTEIEPERKRLNALDALDYEAVMTAKVGFLKRVFPSQKHRTFASKSYQEFFAGNRPWLEPYAAFCYLRDKYGTADFQQWPAHRRYVSKEIEALLEQEPGAADAVAFNCFLQYHLHFQLKDAAEYVHQQGLVLKGDIPIGVSRHGADAWEQPELYHTEFQAGAPPDAFSAKGQNWSFPTYNWPRMKQDGFAWWKRRFEQMSRYFDAFRIDHILGFFRIWSIPTHAVEGIMGHFEPVLPVEAGELARRGIWFDRERFTRPYITDAVLQAVFGAEQDYVKREFLKPNADGHYSLKPEFATQRQVERYFAGLEADDTDERLTRIKIGLFDLISNVILFEDETAPGHRFHFRFSMEGTLSFQHLPRHTQAQLRDLYVDYFFRRQDAFWMSEAMTKLPALKRVTNMLVCGEDLGLVPACVPQVMEQLGLLCLEVQRMPKEMNRAFSRPQDAPYLSVVTPSTHDMSTIRGWWIEDRNVTQTFFNQELGQPGTAPQHCEAWINRAVILQHLHSPAIWSIFQLQDMLGMDEALRHPDPTVERINIPANPRHYWRYRMHLPLERLLEADGFNQALKECLQSAGR